MGNIMARFGHEDPQLELRADDVEDLGTHLVEEAGDRQPSPGTDRLGGSALSECSPGGGRGVIGKRSQDDL